MLASYLVVPALMLAEHQFHAESEASPRTAGAATMGALPASCGPRTDVPPGILLTRTALARRVAITIILWRTRNVGR